MRGGDRADGVDSVQMQGTLVGSAELARIQPFLTTRGPGPQLDVDALLLDEVRPGGFGQLVVGQGVPRAVLVPAPAFRVGLGKDRHGYIGQHEHAGQTVDGRQSEAPASPSGILQHHRQGGAGEMAHPLDAMETLVGPHVEGRVAYGVELQIVAHHQRSGRLVEHGGARPRLPRPRARGRPEEGGAFNPAAQEVFTGSQVASGEHQGVLGGPPRMRLIPTCAFAVHLGKRPLVAFGQHDRTGQSVAEHHRNLSFHL